MSPAPSPPERILALHPTQPERSVRVRRDRYDACRKSILSALRRQGPLTLHALIAATPDILDTGLSTRMWYVRTVKLDLETRGIIERLPHSRPHRVRLV